MHEKVHAKHCKKLTWKVNTVCQPNLGSLCHAIKKIYIYKNFLSSKFLDRHKFIDSSFV